jgi:hypothetical protein
MTTLHDQWTTLYAAGRVRWMPGMRVAPNVYGECGVVAAVRDGSNCIALNERDTDGWPLLMWASTNYIMIDGQPKCEFFPDFSDPATIGCLLHQAREAWDADSVNTHVVRHHMLPGGEKWVILIDGFQPGIEGPTRIAAILATIAAAPPKVSP